MSYRPWLSEWPHRHVCRLFLRPAAKTFLPTVTIIPCHDRSAQPVPTQNFGVVTNIRVLMANITFKEHIGKLNVQLRGNFTYSKNKIVECDEVSHLYAYQDYTGCSIGTPLIYIADGLYTPDDFNVTTNSEDGRQDLYAEIWAAKSRRTGVAWWHQISWHEWRRRD